MASYITGLVIQKNNSVFVGDVSAYKLSTDIITSGIGSTMEIPCPDSASGGVIDGDYWAVPVNEGIVSGFTYLPYSISESVSTKPNPQAFAVVRISSRFSSDDWYVFGTSTQYIASCAACCDTSPATLMPTKTTLPQEAGCQTLCQQTNPAGLYFGILGLPTLTGGRRYFPYGYFNGVALTEASASGYANTTTLLSFLNASWSVVGTWALSGDSIIVTQAAGDGNDELCAQIVEINQSA